MRGKRAKWVGSATQERRARFLIDPLMLLQAVLPPGNTVVAEGETPDGTLVYEIVGVDVPNEAEEPLPMLTLQTVRDAAGVRSFWFETTARMPIR